MKAYNLRNRNLGTDIFLFLRMKDNKEIPHFAVFTRVDNQPSEKFSLKSELR